MAQERGDYATRFKPKGIGTKSGQKPISVLLPVNVDSMVRSLPNRSKWIREAVMEKLKRDELMRQPVDPTKLSESQEMTSEDEAWLEADIEGELPPYDWGDIDPLTLGKPVEYIPGKGTVIVEE